MTYTVENGQYVILGVCELDKTGGMPEAEDLY
jgi:hypothetical protein